MSARANAGVVFVAAVVAVVAGGGGVASKKVEVCEKRPRFTYNALDALVVDGVQTMLDAACNRTGGVAGAVDGVFQCLAKVMDQPGPMLAWTYRRQLPHLVGLKNYFCAYEREATKCYDFHALVNHFSCPEGYGQRMRRAADGFVKLSRRFFCSGHGHLMISLIASEGDACLSDGRAALVRCMHRALPTLRSVSVRQRGRPASSSSSSSSSYSSSSGGEFRNPLAPACNALDVMRHCAAETYAGVCSSAIPVKLVDDLLAELGRDMSCAPPLPFHRRSFADDDGQRRDAATVAAAAAAAGWWRRLVGLLFDAWRRS